MGDTRQELVNIKILFSLFSLLCAEIIRARLSRF